ncbi:MAG TPA: ABC transporter substrate-binding protein [Candidatus Binatia bacterium]|nr:ABC transporter substrate-binding protein [Candidatus Binatia bacterium]
MGRGWIRLLIFTWGLSLTAPASAIDKITVGYGSIGGGMWPLVVAQKKGMLARNGIDATFIFIEGGTRALTAMVSGEVSFLHVGGTEAINAALGGADVVILSSLVNTLSFDLIVTPEIQRAENLKGKRLAISRFGSTTDVGLKMALKKLGFNPNDAAYLQIGSNQARLNAMLSGQVQGALLNSDSHAPLARKQGLHTLASLPDLGIEFLQLSTVTSHAYIKSRPQIVRQYLRAQVEAIAWLRDERNRQEALQILGQFLRNQDGELLGNMYDSLVKKAFQPAPYATIGGAQNILDQIAISNPKAKQAKAQDFIDDRLLRELEDSGYIQKLYRP